MLKLLVTLLLAVIIAFFILRNNKLENDTLKNIREYIQMKEE